MSECKLNVTQAVLDSIRESEAVVIREYERSDGSRIGEIVGHGTADEMNDVSDTPGLTLVPIGLTVVCQSVVMVEDLLGV